MNRYIIAGLAFIGLGLLLILLLFSGGGHKSTPPPPLRLTTFANTNAEVKMVVGGPIVAPQNHDSMEIIVGKDSSTFNLYQGYDNQVITSKTYNNSVNSYTNFLYALYYAGFTRGSVNNSNPGSIGLCSIGSRYDFYLTEYGNNILHYWGTNCSGSAHTYLGSQGLTISLFEDQIPDISTLLGTANI